MSPPGYLDLSTLQNADKVVRVLELGRSEEVKPVPSNQKKASLKKSPSIDQVSGYLRCCKYKIRIEHEGYRK